MVPFEVVPLWCPWHPVASLLLLSGGVQFVLTAAQLIAAYLVMTAPNLVGGGHHSVASLFRLS